MLVYTECFLSSKKEIRLTFVEILEDGQKKQEEKVFTAILHDVRRKGKKESFVYRLEDSFPKYMLRVFFGHECRVL